MDPKYYLPGESLLAESDNKQIILTTHRLRYQSSTSGTANTTSFMLDKISSVQTHYQSAVLLLVIGIMVCVAGMALISANQRDPDIAMVAPAGIIIGIIFIIVFFVSRKHTAVITADCGTKISFEINSSKREMMYDFINKIEKAKNERFLKLKSISQPPPFTASVSQ